MLKSIIKRIDEAVTFNSGLQSEIELMSLEILSFVEQTHIYHLITKSYADHMAIGSFYESIQSNADSFTEAYLGMNGGAFSAISDYNTSFKVSYNKATFIAELDTFRTSISGRIESTNKPEYMSINDILISIQTDIDSLRYKLNFK